MYGESSPAAVSGAGGAGLSPRVRGIHHGRPRPAVDAGSIPACTGNPPAQCGSRSTRKVYPRVYGESTSSRTSPGIDTGLSPRVRGIPQLLEIALSTGGSIPACTGNPAPFGRRWTTERVYPRVYGESAGPMPRGGGAPGLSPRVRGIPTSVASPSKPSGSIPACTGNPVWPRRIRRSAAVYPRVYGESR